MIGALATGGEVLGDPRYAAAAGKAANFILDRMRTPEGGLLRTWRGGQARIDAFLEDYALPLDGDHGVAHWARVLENGLRLAEETQANVEVVSLFAVLHDSRRINEFGDPDHGPRAAAFAAKLRGRVFELEDSEFRLLCRACEGHTHERTHPDVTIQTCWDSDVSISAGWASRRTPAAFAPRSPGAPKRSSGPMGGRAFASFPNSCWKNGGSTWIRDRGGDGRWAGEMKLTRGRISSRMRPPGFPFETNATESP